MALALGLSMVILSEEIINPKIKKNCCRSMYFDFNDYLINGERGQPPFTPIISVIIQLYNRLLDIDAVGVEMITENTR